MVTKKFNKGQNDIKYENLETDILKDVI